MKLPNNINKEHLIKAANKIIKEGIPKNAHSSTYDVVYSGRYLPPKLIVSYANFFANNEELDRSTFKGGIGTDSFMLLKRNGFFIQKKSGFYSQLEKFLKQANTTELKTKHYKNSYNDLKVKVSFGQGNVAKIPWISFLKEPNTTSNGIYPVYLYYKDLGKIILAYGISETNKPQSKWILSSEVKIEDYFKKNDLGKPVRYGKSYVFKVYDINDLPPDITIDNDINEIIEIYKKTSGEPHVFKSDDKLKIEQKKFNISSFNNSLEHSGLLFNSLTTTRFISSLITKPFVLLSGLSGSGKTKLAQAFVQWICQDDSQYCIVPVGADWTNREPLLGYPNALKQDDYIKPDNGALDVIIQANTHPDLPHFLILDEMNLSHVERYFADFLSVMESNGEISLFAEGTVSNGVPAKLNLPSNLFIIGTVNIDETTYMFSPKVLDRANTIEFRVTKDEIENFFANQQDVDMNKLKTKGVSMAQSFLGLAENRAFVEKGLVEIHKTLVDFFEQLKKAGAEFGYRSAVEIIRLINQLTVIDTSLNPQEKLDIAIMQKLLPKLHGSRRKLNPILITLGSFCIDKTNIKNIEKEVLVKEDFDFETEGVLFPISLEKITRMYKGAIENGFASYAEA